MMRTTIFRSDRMAIALVGALMAPTFAFSQDSTVTSRTHVVRKGDTLWDIAREYTSDPFRWKDVYQLNTAIVRDPHWIYPGERLRLPGAAVADNTAAPVTPAQPRDVEPRAVEPSESPTVELAAAPIAAPFDAPTVFRRALDERRPVALTRASRVSQAQTTAAAPTIRPGEFYAAPYVVSAGGPANAGRIVGTGDVPAIPLTEVDRPLQSYERVFVVAPPGMSTATGTRYVAVRFGPMLDGVGQVMIPTGIVTVERAQPGQAVEARIVARFEPMFIGDLLVTMDAVPANLPKPTAQTGGAETAVLWIDSDPALASMQTYLVVAGGSGAGMRAGDQITLYRQRGVTPDGIVLPESEIAVAQIVRVTPQASTALVIDQTYGAIRQGTAARVTAKMP